MWKSLPAVALAATIGWVGTATADHGPESEVLFRHKKWEVAVVALGDDSVECNAAVQSGDSNFSIWANSNEVVQLQFYSQAWQFTDEKADIKVEVDRRGVWDLSNASLQEQSVFFTLNDSKASTRLLREIMAGNRLKLGNSDGDLIYTYSLSGSHASILKLIECVRLLQEYEGRTNTNPFN